MYDYLQALERAGGQAFIANEECIYALAFETTRHWTDEEPGKFRLEETIDYYPVTLHLDQAKIINLYAEGGEHLFIPPILIQTPEQLETIIRKLALAHSDKVSLEEGSIMIDNLLSQYTVLY